MQQEQDIKRVPIQKMSPTSIYEKLEHILNTCQNHPAVRESTIQDLIWDYCGDHQCDLEFNYDLHEKSDEEFTKELSIELEELSKKPEKHLKLKSSFSWAPVRALEFNASGTKLKAHLWDSSQIIWDLTTQKCLHANVYKTFLIGFDEQADKKEDVIIESALFKARCKHMKDSFTIRVETKIFKLLKLIRNSYNKKKIQNEEIKQWPVLNHVLDSCVIL